MRAYIDESGDEGTGGRGTRWLTFGCALVKDSHEAAVESAVKAACTHLGDGKPRLIHFKKLTHPDKCGVLDRFTASHVQWNCVVVASDTTKILPGSYLHIPQFQYNYALRYVIERVSKYAELINEEATIYIEDRRNFDLPHFRNYLYKLQAQGETRINWQCIDPQRIHVARRKDLPGLCVADGIAHASFRALQRDNKWGLCEIAYLDMIAPRLWRGRSSDEVFVNGLVLMPTALWSEFASEYVWLEHLRENARLR